MFTGQNSPMVKCEERVLQARAEHLLARGTITDRVDSPIVKRIGLPAVWFKGG